MSMHYIAQREEHAEQAFLATVKLRADGTRVQCSRTDHDSLHDDHRLARKSHGSRCSPADDSSPGRVRIKQGKGPCAA